jgi:hypothetical protein
MQKHQALPTGPTSGFADEKPVNFQCSLRVCIHIFDCSLNIFLMLFLLMVSSN